MKDKTVREPVKALIRALKGNTGLENEQLLRAITDHLWDRVDTDGTTSWLTMVQRRNVLRNRLAKQRAATRSEATRGAGR